MKEDIMSNLFRDKGMKFIGIRFIFFSIIFMLLYVVITYSLPHILNKDAFTHPINTTVLNENIQFRAIGFGTDKKEQKAIERKRSSTEVSIVDDWFKRSGYSTIEDDVYRSYSNAVLEDLSNKGDLAAMRILEEKNLAKGNLTGAKAFAEKGIVHGSLQSIQSMANYTEPSMKGLPYDIAISRLKESLAYLSLLKIRGDGYRASVSRAASLKVFGNGYNVQNPLSSEDDEWINTRAEQLYKQYQTTRTELGLGDFDNDIPQEVKDFYEK